MIPTYEQWAQAYLQSLILDYQSEFEMEPAKDEHVADFRKGMLFAYRYAITHLNHMERDQVVKPQ